MTGLALLLVALVALVASLGPPVAAQEVELSVDMVEFEFRPAPIRVPPGAVVTFVNLDGQVHTATSVAPGFDTGNIDPGVRRAIAAPGRAGEYAFYCVHHAAIGEKGVYEGMVGTLVVEDGAPDADAAPAPGPGAVWLVVAGLALAVLLPKRLRK